SSQKNKPHARPDCPLNRQAVTPWVTERLRELSRFAAQMLRGKHNPWAHAHGYVLSSLRDYEFMSKNKFSSVKPRSPTTFRDCISLASPVRLHGSRVVVCVDYFLIPKSNPLSDVFYEQESHRSCAGLRPCSHCCRWLQRRIGTFIGFFT
ncbi:MAG: hypothetical protein ABGZ53_29525, partial [Fuerstiella sp.]